MEKGLKVGEGKSKSGEAVTAYKGDKSYYLLKADGTEVCRSDSPLSFKNNGYTFEKWEDKGLEELKPESEPKKKEPEAKPKAETEKAAQAPKAETKPKAKPKAEEKPKVEAKPQTEAKGSAKDAKSSA